LHLEVHDRLGARGDARIARQLVRAESSVEAEDLDALAAAPEFERRARGRGSARPLDSEETEHVIERLRFQLGLERPAAQLDVQRNAPGQRRVGLAPIELDLPVGHRAGTSIG
jgi:hypothetical protein